MKLTKHLLDGIKLAALFGAVALVVWSMPEYESRDADHRLTGRFAIDR